MKLVKKMLIVSSLLFSLNAFADSEIIENGECVLIKENRLSDYLPKEEVDNFLKNRFIDTIETESIIYSIEEVSRNLNRRVKTFKVCANYKD